MTKLTEDMVIARTKCSELGAVKKLNCWGSDLVDVSLVKRLNNVEVLSLSLNKIASLTDFQFCRNLVELYIRRNAIRDLSELCYLQDLTRLRRLLLAENPCVETAGPAYRATVIRCLPYLEVLDNNEVTPEEVDHAMRIGLILEHPLTRHERVTPEPVYYAEDSPPMLVTNRRASNAVDYEEAFNNSSGLSRSPPPSENSPYIQPEEKERQSPVETPSTPITTDITNGLRHRRHSLQSSGSLIEDRSPLSSSHSNNNTNNLPSEIPVVRRVQRSPVPPPQEFYSPPQQQQPQQRDSGERERRDLTNGYQQRKGSNDYVQETMRMYQEGYFDECPPQQRNSSTNQTQAQQRYVQNSRPKPRTKPSDPRNGDPNSTGPRSSNLLSAVLCLIPELDWASLEVVELAVRRRLDEIVYD